MNLVQAITFLIYTVLMMVYISGKMGSVNFILLILSTLSFTLIIATQNFLIFEKVLCVGYPRIGVKFTKCIARLISRDRIRLHMEATFNRTINSFFIHSSVYYQFSTNEYRPFLFNVWEDFCGYMNGDKRNIVLSVIHPKYVENTNFNHTCPYKPGIYVIKFDNISVNAFDSIDLVPAGRFRLEMSYHVVFNGPSFGRHKIFFSVSDHRIVQF